MIFPMNAAFPEIPILTFYVFTFTHFKVLFSNLYFALFFTHLLFEHIIYHFYVSKSCIFVFTSVFISLCTDNIFMILSI